MDRRSLLLGASGLAAGLAAPSILHAQGAYPARPLRLIVPWPPGQATDLMARVTATKIAESWGQPIVPENRAGAGGMIGTDLVAKAAPDGYTFFMGAVHHSIAPSMYPKLDYDLEKDFIPVALFGRSPFVLAAQPSTGIQSLLRKMISIETITFQSEENIVGLNVSRVCCYTTHIEIFLKY